MNIFKKIREKTRTRGKKLLPIQNGDLMISSIKCIRHRPFYDSTWLLEGTFDGESLIRMVRTDTETLNNLTKLVAECNTVEELYLLDERNSIYYD